MLNKNKSVIVTAVFAAAVLFFLSTPASAHHEAMFGPQSSAVLSPGCLSRCRCSTAKTERGATDIARPQAFTALAWNRSRIRCHLLLLPRTRVKLTHT